MKIREKTEKNISFSAKLGKVSYIVSIPKTAAAEKFEALISYVKFLMSEVVLDHCKSTIWLCMEYCCHLWVGTNSCNSCLDMFGKLQKWSCGAVHPTCADFFESVVHC